MKIELESLIQKFQSCRAKTKGKKVVYPITLRKAASLLSLEHPPKILARELGVSVASIKAWSKAFRPNVSEDDLIPVDIVHQEHPVTETSDDIKVKVIAMEVSIPSAKLAGTLADIIQGMGASSC